MVLVTYFDVLSMDGHCWLAYMFLALTIGCGRFTEERARRRRVVAGLESKVESLPERVPALTRDPVSPFAGR